MTSQLRGPTDQSLMLAVIALVAGALPCHVAAQHDDVSDADISMAVGHEFLLDDAVPFDRIDIETEDGIVALSGSVSSLGARLQAEQLAGIVKGVRSVSNRIDVEAGDRSSEEVQAGVAAALRAEPATEKHEINVQVDSLGGVTLSGQVDSWAEKSVAENVVMAAAGVTAIDNRVSVAMATDFRYNEHAIASEIRGRLRWDVRVDDSLVDVTAFEGGRVALTGTVGSLAEKNQAERLAWVQGVNSVDSSHLDVERWARDDDLRRGKHETKSDAQVRDALIRALAYDPRVLRAPIDVRVDAGTVWLSGSVDNLNAKASAERDARNTVGVDRVINHLKVRPEVLTDPVIATQIKDSMRSHGLLANNRVHVAVRDRHARLTGDVDSSVEYWQAVRAASSARGLESLDNDLTIAGQQPTLVTYWSRYYPRLVQPRTRVDYGIETDRQIHEDVSSELFWSPFVDEDDIAVEVDDGIVTLTGTAGSRREWRAARDNAFEGGAVSVRNNVSIEEE